MLRLESVSDVAGAATRRALVGSEDAFALKFSGPLQAARLRHPHHRHPLLGSIELFASPVDAPEADRNYEVVVDRSVGAPSAQDTPKRPEPAPAEPPAEETAPAKPEQRPEPEPRPRWCGA